MPEPASKIDMSIAESLLARLDLEKELAAAQVEASALQGKLDTIVRVLGQDRDAADRVYRAAKHERETLGATHDRDVLVVSTRAAWLEAKAAAATARRIAQR